MLDTKLILLEGIPGSGKSTTAQFLARQLHRLGIPHKWWYEEEQGHPVYIFDDPESMLRVVDELAAGHYLSVIEKALHRWRSFSSALQASSEVILIDSCLFGYLTWSLFPYNVPVHTIKDYVLEVERILEPCKPALIYTYQKDIGKALRTIVTRRGGETESRFIRAATECAYGKTRALHGFEGMVQYWQDYRAMTDEFFRSLKLKKLSIDNSALDWQAYGRLVADFLNHPLTEPAPRLDSTTLSQLEGFYHSIEDSDPAKPLVQIRCVNGLLIADGLPQTWPQSTLLPFEDKVFDVQSLPFQVRFEEMDSDVRMYLTGPNLLGGAVHHAYVKR
ncbi:hypothetical protein [Paenibacillus sp. HJGM_3]|uniref:hypothetical protein n=1 Tax=Paenibacillus sp. HJGM_3 TaxID=3379816 RepID=UPI0038592BA9